MMNAYDIEADMALFAGKTVGFIFDRLWGSVGDGSVNHGSMGHMGRHYSMGHMGHGSVGADP